jgi:hypothetical protein
MNSNGSLTGQFISQAKRNRAEDHRLDLEPARELQEQREHAAGWVLARELLRLVVDDDRQLRAAAGAVRHVDRERVRLRVVRSRRTPCTDDYDTTTYTAKQMVAWVKVAGPKLKAKGVKVIAPEGLGMDPRLEQPIGDGLARFHPSEQLRSAEVWVLREHHWQHDRLRSNLPRRQWLRLRPLAREGYDGVGCLRHLRRARVRLADRVRVAGRRQRWRAKQGGLADRDVRREVLAEEGPSTDINNGVVVAGWIHSALTVGEASAWLWWWYEAYYQNDNEGLAIIQGSSTVAKRYFTLGNYSKFVRPGYVAVDVVGNSNANVLISAYKGTDGTVVVVAVNKGTAAVTVPIAITAGRRRR